MNCVMRTRLIGHLCVLSLLLAGCSTSVKTMHIERDPWSGYRQAIGGRPSGCPQSSLLSAGGQASRRAGRPGFARTG